MPVVNIFVAEASRGVLRRLTFQFSGFHFPQDSTSLCYLPYCMKVIELSVCGHIPSFLCPIVASLREKGRGDWKLTGVAEVGGVVRFFRLDGAER